MIIQLIRRKKLPGKILLMEAGCLILFFYLRYLVDQHELIVFGDYREDPQHYGEGMANAAVYTYNLAFVIGLFLITQLVFWAFFTEKYKNLNRQKQEREIDIDKFLSQENPE